MCNHILKLEAIFVIISLLLKKFPCLFLFPHVMSGLKRVCSESGRSYSQLQQDWSQVVILYLHFSSCSFKSFPQFFKLCWVVQKLWNLHQWYSFPLTVLVHGSVLELWICILNMSYFGCRVSNVDSHLSLLIELLASQALNLEPQCLIPF